MVFRTVSLWLPNRMALGFELFSLLDPYITCVLAFLKGIRLLHLIVQCQILFQDFEKKKKASPYQEKTAYASVYDGH